MFRKMLASVREFKTPTFLTVLFIVLEAIIEAFIPFITAELINYIQTTAALEMTVILRYGILLVVMAMLSLTCGGVAAYTCARASSGFSRNLRQDVFNRIQTFSFENIDKFSATSLVTRLTTDVHNVQMSYMMVIRTAIRAPLMLIFCIIMAGVMGGWLALSFAVLVPFLTAGLLLVARRAMPAFRAVFRKYDNLNESIEENVRGMRVVKGFSREEYEKKKFGLAADDICRDFTRAERIVALNSPLMQICVYANMVFVMLVGSMLAINSGGVTVNVGHMSAMLTYGMQILMQLMMLSMIYVMLTMSSESMKRISEVLSEQSALVSPENALTEVADGSIDFDGVSFKYSAKAERYALEGIDLHITSGMTVGILGGTGSSKSTLVQLIPRLYDATVGRVRVGGHDVREYDLDALRGAVAMVLQKNLLLKQCFDHIEYHKKKKDPRYGRRWGTPNPIELDVHLRV